MMDDSFELGGVNESFSEVQVKTTLLCDICQYVTTKKYNLKRHMKVHNDKDEEESTGTSVKNQHLCGNCGKQFKSIIGMKHHERKVHQNVFSYICPTCGKGYNGLANYRGHLALHDPALREKCTKCKKTFTYRKSFLIHRKRCGKADVQPVHVPCLQCDKEFSSIDSMRQHARVVHDNKTYRCKKCIKSFKWRSSLAYHTKRCKGAVPF